MSTHTKEELAPKNIGSANVQTPYLSAEAVVNALNEKIDRAGDSNIGPLHLSGSINIGLNNDMCSIYSACIGTENISYNKYSTALGWENNAGTRVTMIKAIDTENSTISVDGISGLAAGDWITYKFDRNFDRRSEILSVITDSCLLSVSNIISAFEISGKSDSKSINNSAKIWVIGKPAAGTQANNSNNNEGAAFATGQNCIAQALGAAAFGCGSVAAGRYSFAAGLNSKAFAYNSIALGISAEVSGQNQFGWRGSAFKVDPAGGLSSFYVGEKSIQTTLNELVNCNVYICETQAEIDSCKKELSPTFEQIYNSWTRFGHYNGTQYDVDAGYTGGGTSGASAWYYDSGISTICQPVNTTDFTGYVSNKKYGDYEFTIRAYSTNSDDDFNGIVAAFATDANGRQHTLSFIRTPNNQNGGEALTHHWFCCLDTNSPFTPSQTTYGQKLLANCADLNSASEDSSSWSTKGVGALVNVVREGNVFTAKTTKFENSKASVDKSELAYELVVDLDALVQDKTLSAYWDVLNLFRRPASIGYCTFSQASSMYQNVEFPEDEYVIVNLATGKVEKFNKTTRSWDAWDVDPLLTVGCGRFAYNDVTKKQFFNNGSLIFNVSSSDGANSFSSTDTADISDNDGMIAAVKQILMKLGMKESNITVA